MQRIMNVDRWFKLSPGEALAFDVTRARSVTVEVNAAYKTRIDLIDAESGEVTFLALVEGRDRIEFQTTGAFSLTVDQPDTFIYSDDSQSVHSVVEAPESFTRVMAGRRQRNPELEFIAKKMGENFQRQLDRQARHYEGILERGLATRPVQPAPSGAPSGDGGKSAPDADGKSSPDEAAGTADGSSGATRD